MPSRDDLQRDATPSETADRREVASVASLLDLGSAAGVLRMQRSAGNRATAAALANRQLGRRVLARIGQRLDEDLPATAIKPAEGEDKGEQRRYSREQFQQLWEEEQGNKLTGAWIGVIKYGCIGITANQLTGGTPPTDLAYSTFDKARQVADTMNAGLHRDEPKRWIVFGMHFWSNQDSDSAKRELPDKSAFLPGADGKVDMTGYKNRARPRHINFDYGYWDESTQSHWHANHTDYDYPPDDPMLVYQSTRAKFSHVFEETTGEFRYGYEDFDREIFGVARTEHYDVTRSTKRGLTSPRFAGDTTLEKVFNGGTTLQSGSPKASVTKVQQALVDRGYDLGDFGPNKDGVDGKYGDRTGQAVMKFKADENLSAQKSKATTRGVIYRLDELFPPVATPAPTP
jgi:hypothetical protein